MVNIISVSNLGHSNRFLLVVDDLGKMCMSIPFQVGKVIGIEKAMLESGSILVFDAMDDLTKFVAKELPGYSEEKVALRGRKRRR